MPCNVDNPSEYSEKCVQLYQAVHEYAGAGYSIRRIAGILHCSRNTVTKYLTGDYDCLCRRNYHSGMDSFRDYIIKELSSGISRADVYRSLVRKGYKGKCTAAYEYMNYLIKELHIEISLYRSSSAQAVQERKKFQKFDHLSRSGIFRFLWMNLEISGKHKKYLMDTYPEIGILHTCIQEFREIFEKRSMPCLYLFIERYSQSEIKALSQFAASLQKDMEAVENAVASSLSNGFVEGTNNKLKMIKRTMYGRCGRELLAAKLMYVKSEKTGDCG